MQETTEHAKIRYTRTRRRLRTAKNNCFCQLAQLSLFQTTKTDAPPSAVTRRRVLTTKYLLPNLTGSLLFLSDVEKTPRPAGATTIACPVYAKHVSWDVRRCGNTVRTSSRTTASKALSPSSDETCLARWSNHPMALNRCIMITLQRSMRTGGMTVGSYLWSAGLDDP